MENIFEGAIFTEEKAKEVGLVYTWRNFGSGSDAYPIYKLNGNIYIMKKIGDEKLKVYMIANEKEKP
jgi:hypothetical protein